jgi:hypothetical protein
MFIIFNFALIPYCLSSLAMLLFETEDLIKPWLEAEEIFVVAKGQDPAYAGDAIDSTAKLRD